MTSADPQSRSTVDVPHALLPTSLVGSASEGTLRALRQASSATADEDQSVILGLLADELGDEGEGQGEEDTKDEEDVTQDTNDEDILIFVQEFEVDSDDDTWEIHRSDDVAMKTNSGIKRTRDGEPVRSGSIEREAVKSETAPIEQAQMEALQSDATHSDATQRSFPQ